MTEQKPLAVYFGPYCKTPNLGVLVKNALTLYVLTVTGAAAAHDVCAAVGGAAVLYLMCM